MNPVIEGWPRRDGRELLRSGGLNGGFDAIAAQAHAAADPGVPTTSRLARRANADGLGLAATGGVGRPAGQHAESRAALVARARRGVQSSTWEDPSLAQLWGPRYSTYVVPKRDFALFSLGRLPDSAKGRLRAERMAERLHAHLDGRRMTDREAARALGVGNAIRYAATTGTVAIRWEGARAPTIWTVAAAKIEPADACRELARRYLHVFGPATAERVRPLGRNLPRVGDRGIRVARGIAAAGPIAARRRVAARGGRARDARPRDRRTRPHACCRAAMPTSCSTEQSGSFSFRARIGGSVSGRPACGRARSSSTARSAEPGDGRSTRFGSMPGYVSRVARATRSRPRPPRCRFQPSTGVSR